MIQQINYDPKDIEKFLEATEIPDDNSDLQILDKLLSVQNKISIIANIDPEDLEAIVYDLKFIQYQHRDHVIEEGDITQEIFFVFSGECQVFHKNKKVGEIKTGKTFGEPAAIFNTKRNATVVCSSQKATILSFCIDNDAIRFCAPALALLYKNLAYQINNKLEEMNENILKK